MDLFEAFKKLDEGTWAVPYEYEQAKEMANLITSNDKITLQNCKFCKYEDADQQWVFRFPLGDDSFYDDLKEGSPKDDTRDIRPIIKKHISRIVKTWIADSDNFTKKFNPKAIKVLADACAIKLPDKTNLFSEAFEDDAKKYEDDGSWTKLGEDSEAYKFLVAALNKTAKHKINLLISYVAEVKAEDKTFYIAELYGGLNGIGDWLDYMDELDILFEGTNCWMLDLTNDSADDVFVFKIGFELHTPARTKQLKLS